MTRIAPGRLAIALGTLLPAVVSAQQPTEPGWPQPMNNDRSFGYAILNQNELRTGDGHNTYRWAGEGWYGGNINRAWFKTEGNVSADTGAVDEGEVQGLYSRAISAFFDLQAGVRYDFKPSPSRGWAAFGVQGLAPLMFEVNAFAFVSDGGNYAARVEGHYDLRLTQRFVLQPQLEANFYSRNDPQRAIGAGISDIDTGIRLRYEFRREIAPYIGIAYQTKFGRTADYARDEGVSVDELRFVAGLRLWY